MTDEQPLAQERTDWAEDRTALANERTFAAWMRTSMASIGVAIGLKAVFSGGETDWLAKAVATAFLIAAAYIVVAARRQAIATHRRIHGHDAATQPNRSIHLISVIILAGAVSTAVILWIL